MLSKNAENPVGKRLRVAMLDFGADEAVVAKLPKRVGVMTLRAKGFTKSVHLLYNNLIFKDDF